MNRWSQIYTAMSEDIRRVPSLFPLSCPLAPVGAGLAAPLPLPTTCAARGACLAPPHPLAWLQPANPSPIATHPPHRDLSGLEGYCFRNLVVGKTSTLNFYQVRDS